MEEQSFIGGMKGFLKEMIETKVISIKLENPNDYCNVDLITDFNNVYKRWKKEIEKEEETIHKKENVEQRLIKKRKVAINDISKLPEELILTIFNYLEFKIILLTISKVNKLFRNIANDWKYLETKYKYENLYSFLLIDSFRDKLNSPEKKYKVLIEPGIQIHLAVERIKQSKYVDLENSENESKEILREDTCETDTLGNYLFGRENNTDLLKYVTSVHENMKYQVPPSLQQLLSETTRIIQPLPVEFVIQPFYFKDPKYSTQPFWFIERKEEWVKLFSELKEEEEDEENENDSDTNVDLLLDNLTREALCDNPSAIPYLMWEHSMIPFGYAKNNSLGLFCVTTNDSDLRYFGNFVAIDAVYLKCCAERIPMHKFIGFIAKEIECGHQLRVEDLESDEEWF